MSGGKIKANIDDAIAPMSDIMSPKSGIAIAKAHTTMTRAYRNISSHIIIFRAKQTYHWTTLVLGRVFT